MRKIIWVLVLLLGFGYSGAQDMNSKAENLSKRQERKAERLAYLNEVEEWARDSTLVIEAHFLSGRYSPRRMVNDNNFIEIIGDQIIIQTSNPALLGYNGIGGMTLRGYVRDYEVKRSKNSVNISMQVSTRSFGFATINILVTGGKVATAEFYGQRGGRLTFFGDAYHPDENLNYKAVPII